VNRPSLPISDKGGSRTAPTQRAAPPRLPSEHAPSLAAAEVSLAVGERLLLRDVSVSFHAGEVVALVGPNGAGKSTLVRVLAGDLMPTSGRVLLDGRPISTYKPRELALRRAVLPQQTVLQFAFTAREVVEMGRTPHLERGSGERDAAVVARSLARTDSVDLAERIYPSLSVGEQARVSLARVLAQETPILILDEPTAALDLQHQGMVMDLAHEIAREGGLVVAVLHDLNLAAAYADRVMILHGGRLVADGSPWETLTEGLLSEVFACPILVTRHPARDCPLVLPIPSQEIPEAPS
jgi:iron complex transport system ATP-binding protein